MPDRDPMPSSLYAQEAPPGPPPPPLVGDRRTDVVVVGAGYTGLSAALHLAEQGADVTVLEAAEVGWGASGRNGGQVNPGLKGDPDAIEARFGAERAARMILMAYAAPDLVFDLVERHAIACNTIRSGTIRAAYVPRDVPAIRASFMQGVRRGMPMELLESSAVQEATGSTRYLAAMLDRRGGQLDPLAYARGLATAGCVPARASTARHG